MQTYCCQTHVDTGLDRFIAEEKTFPDLSELSKEEKLSTKCDYCEEAAIYLVSRK